MKAECVKCGTVFKNMRKIRTVDCPSCGAYDTLKNFYSLSAVPCAGRAENERGEARDSTNPEADSNSVTNTSNGISRRRAKKSAGCQETSRALYQQGINKQQEEHDRSKPGRN